MSQVSGAGHGLSLIKSFIETHGSHVELESKPDTGTRVICYLPARNPEQNRAAVTESG